MKSGVLAYVHRKTKPTGYYKGWDLASQPSKRLQTQFNIAVARTVLELNGISCMSLEEIAPDKQQIVCSKSLAAG